MQEYTLIEQSTVDMILNGFIAVELNMNVV